MAHLVSDRAEGTGVPQTTSQQPVARLAPEAEAERVARLYLHDEVHRQMLRLLDRGELPEGTRLPTELELAARFGVSRPIVRQALAQLRAEGRVATRKGSGTIVVRGGSARPAYPVLAGLTELRQFYEFRITLEGQSAALAAERRGEADLAAMGDCLDRSEAGLKVHETRLVSDMNFAFHRAVAHASGNDYFAATLDALPNIVGETIAGRAFGTPAQNEARQWRLLAEHRLVLAAIERGDAAAASRAMLDHIARSMRFMFDTSAIERLLALR